MFGRKKISVEIIKERISKLEEAGINELNAGNVHNWLYHDYFKKK